MAPVKSVRSSGARLSLKVNLVSGEHLATLDVEPSFTFAQVKSIVQTYVAEPGMIVQGLLANAEQITPFKAIGDQVKSGDTLTAVVCQDPVQGLLANAAQLTSFKAVGDQVKNLLASLSKSDVSLRYQAVEALAELGPSAAEAASAVGQVLRQDPNVHVRKSAAWALGQFGLGATSVMPKLRSAAACDENKFVREMAAEALQVISQLASAQSAL